MARSGSRAYDFPLEMIAMTSNQRAENERPFSRVTRTLIFAQKSAKHKGR